MNKTQRISIATLLTVILLLGIIVTIHSYDRYQRTHLNCDAMLVVSKDDAELSLALNYTLRGDSGIATLKGTLKKGSQITNISRKNYFAFSQEKNFYHLTSLSTVVSPADNSDTQELMRYLPRFYLQKGLKFDFIIKPVAKEGYIFSTGYVPSFYCTRN
ncbi:hypothetical protein ACQKDS_06895 [Serratia sp. NPDC078593]|uniref:hypothetical protein n=1 Tax=unclassified Serratia (in: enterobacteria) TaxID=2647522 RepID=UPI0037D6A20D